jgi:hemoglobin-like flavoprotein
MTAQRAKLFNELDEIAHAIPDLGAFVGRATALGHNHIGYGVRAEHYRAFGQALLVTLPACVGGEWNDELAEAWRLAYHLVADSMQRASLV